MNIATGKSNRELLADNIEEFAPFMSVQMANQLREALDMEFPVSGNKLPRLKKRRSTHIPRRHLTTDGVIKRTIAKHRALKDSAADLNRLTGIAGIR